MYDYKKFHVWLMVISFWVLHTFGTHAIFKNYNFFSLNKGNLYADLHNQYEDIFTDFLHAKDSDLLPDNKNTSFFRNMMKMINQKNRVATQEITLCDNRIDKIDKQYPEYLCTSNLNIEGNQLISVV